jgi:uncharacterized protein YcfJ
MNRVRTFTSLAAMLGLAACATWPTGPSVMVLPGSTKTFDAFRADDGVCRQYALEQVGGVTAQQASNQNAVVSAVIGSAIGAAAGAAFGGGQGAAIGAGTGLIVGSAAGAGYAGYAGATNQQRYDFAYTQCMYLKGNKVPVAGQVVPQGSRQYTYSYPPPPPNAPPPGGSTYYPPPPPPH